MANVSINTEKLNKMASFVTSAAPQLEKFASEQAALQSAAPAWVDGLIDRGLLKKEARDSAVRDILDGGIAKIAEVMEYLINNVGPQTTGAPSEKRASAAPVVSNGRRASDVAFENAILG